MRHTGGLTGKRGIMRKMPGGRQWEDRPPGRRLLELVHVSLGYQCRAGVDHAVDLLALDCLDQAVKTELGHLLRELSDGSILLALGDGVFLATAEVEADQDHLM